MKTLGFFFIFECLLIHLSPAEELKPHVFFSPARKSAHINYVRLKNALENLLPENSSPFEIKVLEQATPLPEFQAGDILIYNLHSNSNALLNAASNKNFQLKAENKSPVKIFIDMDIANPVFFRQKTAAGPNLFTTLLENFVESNYRLIVASEEIKQSIIEYLKKTGNFKDYLNTIEANIETLPHLDSLSFKNSAHQALNKVIEALNEVKNGIQEEKRPLKTILWIEQYNEPGKIGTIDFLEAVMRWNTHSENTFKILPVLSLHPDSSLTKYADIFKNSAEAKAFNAWKPEIGFESLELNPSPLKDSELLMWNLKLKAHSQKIPTLWLSSAKEHGLLPDKPLEELLKTSDLIAYHDYILSISSTAADVAYLNQYQVYYPSQYRENMMSWVDASSFRQIFKQMESFQKSYEAENKLQVSHSLTSEKWCSFIVRNNIVQALR